MSTRGGVKYYDHWEKKQDVRQIIKVFHGPWIFSDNVIPEIGIGQYGILVAKDAVVGACK